jgi:hypothetical protein
MPITESENLEPKNWILRDYEDLDYEVKILEIQRQISELQELHIQIQDRTRLLRTLTIIFGGGLIFSLTCVILYGFNIGGFKLEVSTINILVGATWGEVAGLLGIVYGALFKK